MSRASRFEVDLSLLLQNPDKNQNRINEITVHSFNANQLGLPVWISRWRAVASQPG